MRRAGEVPPPRKPREAGSDRAQVVEGCLFAPLFALFTTALGFVLFALVCALLPGSGIRTSGWAVTVVLVAVPAGTYAFAIRSALREGRKEHAIGAAISASVIAVLAALVFVLAHVL